MASRLGAIATQLEAMASRLEAIAIQLEAMASRLETIATQLEAMASRLEVMSLCRASMLDKRGWKRCSLLSEYAIYMCRPQRILACLIFL